MCMIILVKCLCELGCVYEVYVSSESGDILKYMTIL